MHLLYYIAAHNQGGRIGVIDLSSSTTLIEAQEVVCDRDPQLRRYDRYWLDKPRYSFKKTVQWTEDELKRQNIGYRQESCASLGETLGDVYGENGGICLLFLPQGKRKRKQSLLSWLRSFSFCAPMTPEEERSFNTSLLLSSMY